MEMRKSFLDRRRRGNPGAKSARVFDIHEIDFCRLLNRLAVALEFDFKDRLEPFEISLRAVALDHQALLLDNVLRRMQNHQAKKAALLRPLSLAERFCQEQAGEYQEGMSQSNRALG